MSDPIEGLKAEKRFVKAAMAYCEMVPKEAVWT